MDIHIHATHATHATNAVQMVLLLMEHSTVLSAAKDITVRKPCL
jgi:hypothetical protein